MQHITSITATHVIRRNDGLVRIGTSIIVGVVRTRLDVIIRLVVRMTPNVILIVNLILFQEWVWPQGNGYLKSEFSLRMTALLV